MVQKIETGGTSNTRTPRLRFFIKALFPASDALHITHWAGADSENNAHNNTMAIAITLERTRHFVLLPNIRKPLMPFCRRRRRPLVTQLL